MSKTPIMTKTVQYVGMAFVAAMVMSLQFGPATTASAGDTTAPQSQLSSAPGNSNAQLQHSERGHSSRQAQNRSQGTAQRFEKESLERRGTLRMPVARGVVQA